MTRAPGQRGFALLIVLWTLALLALLGTYLVAAGREHIVLTRDMRDAAVVRAAAEGALQHAIFEVLDRSASRWPPGSAIQRMRIGSIAVLVRMDDETNKINPNKASIAQLQALMEQMSVDRPIAATLAAAIVDWRTPGSQPRSVAEGAPGDTRPSGSPGTPFTRLDQLGEVPGMTPETLALLRPRLTVYTDPDQDLTDAGQGQPVVRVVRILAMARGPGAAMFARRVVVRTNGRRSGRRYEILMSDRIAYGRELESELQLENASH